MIILSVNTSHNASVALFINDELIFHLESERLSNIKYNRFPFIAIDKIKKYVDHIDYLVLSGVNKSIPYSNDNRLNIYQAYVMGLSKTFYNNQFECIDMGDNHHITHAANAFYASGFDEALCVVKDGMGSSVEINISQNGKSSTIGGCEGGTSLIMSYPDNIKILEKKILIPVDIPDFDGWADSETMILNSFSEGLAFEFASKELGFTIHDSGKVMGLSAYGKENLNNKPIYKNNKINNEMFYYVDTLEEKRVKLGINETFESKADFAFSLQKSIQEKVAEEILELLKSTGQKNLCLSGGFFLNCVSNYNLLKQLDDKINIYVDPIATDAGTAIGAGRLFYYNKTQSMKINKQNNIYLGPKYKYSIEDIKNEKVITNVSPSDIAKLISNKNIVAIYQGGSESGPRALGNRSILYDPRDPNGKDHVNVIKKREWFRPFAGSVLKEYAKDWFDLQSLNESKFMMFAVDVLKDKRSLIPAITHVDGTCRVQTVSQEDNENYYNLIREFYKITGVPILFNTSFNLAGDAIVETLDDALNTIKNSEINYLYLPEINSLVYK